MERLIYIDVLKGIAIILVVMGHMFAPYTDYLYSPVNQLIYSVHMPLFIFLSGFVFHMPQERNGTIVTIIKRGLSLLLPFFCFSAVYCFSNDLSYADMLFKNEIHNGYWFTLVLFEIIIFSISTESVLKLLNGGGKMWIDIFSNIVVIFILLIIAKTETVQEPIKTLFSTDKVAKFYMFFQMGRFVGTYPVLGILFRKQLLYVICAISYFVFFSKFGYDLQHVNANSFILPLCGIVVATNLVEKYQEVFNHYDILAKLGKNSLEIYLIHFLVLSEIPINIVDCFGSVYLQIFVLLILSAMCIAVSLIIARIIHYSDFLSFLLLGKGKYLKNIVSKMK